MQQQATLVNQMSERGIQQLHGASPRETAAGAQEPRRLKLCVWVRQRKIRSAAEGPSSVEETASKSIEATDKACWIKRAKHSTPAEQWKK